MRNQYPGTCYRCGDEVAAGDGHFERTLDRFKKWRLQHASCAIRFRGTDVGKPGETEKRERFALGNLWSKASGTGPKAQRARAKLRELGYDA